MSQEILLGFGLKVKNNGKDGYCRVSKTILPSGKTVSIQYDSKDEKALAIRTFGQLNAIAKQQIYEFTDLTFTPGTGGSGGGDGIEVQDLDLNSYAEKTPSLMNLTIDLPQTLLGSNRNGLLKGQVQPKPPLTYDNYEFNESANMVLAENARFIPDVSANPMTDCYAVINPLQQFREYEISFGNQPQTDILIRSPDGSSQVRIKHYKTPNGTYGLDVINLYGSIFPLGDSVATITPINSIVIKFENNLLYILRIADVALTTNFEFPYDHVMDFKIWGDLYEPVNMTGNQFVQLGWANSGLGSRAALLSGYFKHKIGTFAVTLDQSRPSCLFVLREQEPTEKYIVDPTKNDLIIAIMYMMGTINIIITDDLNGQPKFSKSVENSVGLEAVSFNRSASNTIDVINKGVLVGRYVHTADLPDFVQTANFPIGILFNELAFDLQTAFESFAYRIPEHIKDGVYYRLLANATLFDKELRRNDYIQFFGDKSDVIVIRVPEDPELPEIPESIEYYRKQYDSLPEVHEKVSNPKAGDYALLREYGKNSLIFYSPEEYIWKPLLTENNCKGLYTYIPYILNSKVGDFVIISTNAIDITFALYNPYLDRFVEIKPANADLIPEGQTNKFYTDAKVVELLANLFLTDFSGWSTLKPYFDNYVKTVFMSDTMPVMTTANIHAKGKPENLDFKLDGISKVTNQITYQSHPMGFISPTEATPIRAYDLFEFDRLPFNLYNGFWYLNFEVLDYSTENAKLEIGILFNSGYILPEYYTQDIFWMNLESTVFSPDNRVFSLGIYGPSGTIGMGGPNYRFSFGYKKGTIFIITKEGQWVPFATVNADPSTHNNVKFFIRKIYGNGISVGSINAVFGEVFKIPNVG